MSKIHICREHQLDHEQCHAVAEDLLGQLVDTYGGTVKSDGETMRYRHATGMTAVVEPQEGQLDITVKLNLMTRSFGPQIEKQIERALDKHIGED